MSQPDLKDIMAKIQKSLALAQSSDFENESASAMRMAHKLLAKHNLTMADVTEECARDDALVEDKVVNGWTQSWVRVVYQSIARLYFCEYIYMHVRPRIMHIIVGRPHNIAVVHSMTSYVVKTISRLGRAGAKENPDVRSYENSFNHGAAMKIRQRASTMIWEATRANAESQSRGDNAMVLADFYKSEADAIKKFIKDSMSGVRETKSRATRGSASAYADGDKAGSNISLNPQVSRATCARALPSS